MDWGKANRMSKVLKQDGRCFYLAMDHGYFQGPTSRLESVWQAADPLLQYVDALFVTRGILRAEIEPTINTPIILRASGGTSMVAGDLANEAVTVSIDEILRLNVAAVGVSVFIGSDYQHQTILNLANLVNVCEPYGIPVMAVTAVGREMEQRTARYLAHACRICAEHGASVVKTYYTEGFATVAEGCPVPVVMAGGPRVDSDLEVLEFVYDGIQQGAVGVNLGRNIWQNDHPQAMARALRAILHEDATPDEAYEIFEAMANGEKVPVD